MAKYIERGTAIAKLTALEVIEPSATMTDAKRLLADMPAADVAPVVHGRWVEDHDYLKCPECGIMVKRDFTFFDDIGDWNFCPSCGAKMDLEEENETD